MVDWRKDLKTETISVADAIQQLLNNSIGTSDEIHRIIGLISDLTSIIDRQNDRISQLTDIIYDLVPEYEVIETMATDEAEKREILSRYMNRNENYDQ